jgi:uncharacterized OsmC-like protein
MFSIPGVCYERSRNDTTRGGRLDRILHRVIARNPAGTQSHDSPPTFVEMTMDANALREMQAPLKAKYRDTPDAAFVTLKAQGDLSEGAIACKVETGRALIEAGLHPATGGSGIEACSGDMLLEALVACAGVTLKAVATALEFNLKGGHVNAEGDLDFRGTLGVDRTAPVGFRDIRLAFDLDTDEPQERIDTLLKLTERYCVVLQTIKSAPPVAASIARTA